jgi:Patatin-like phospholipase
MSTPTMGTRQTIVDDALVDLALQGGGAHGAFTWGVLDRLLEEKRLRIDGISGTSAGAMNAAALVDGYMAGGADGARKALESFWAAVSRSARFSPFQRGPLDVLLGRWSLDHSPMFVAMDMMSRLFSPYDLNPNGDNPLHKVLVETIDFKRLSQTRSSCSLRPLTSTPAEEGYSGTAKSRPTPSSRQPACPHFSRLSRSTASTTGTADTPATPRSRRWCANANQGTPSSSRSIPSTGRGIRARRGTSSTASTMCLLMRCC